MARARGDVARPPAGGGGSRSPSPDGLPVHPAGNRVRAVANGIRYKFFYVHIRGGSIRFHFLDLHMDGRINLHGGSFAGGPVTASGWHGLWEDLHWMGDDHYVGAMRLSFSYLGNAAAEFHHIAAAQCRYNRDCWVLYEDGVPHAIMYRLEWPEGPVLVRGVPHAWQDPADEIR